MINQRVSKVGMYHYVSDKEWEDLLLHSTTATPFHLASWIRVLSKTFGYRPLFVVAKSQDGRLLAGMPILESLSARGLLREYNSLYWGSYGSAIFREGTDDGTRNAVFKLFLKIVNKFNVKSATVVDFAGDSSFLGQHASTTREAFAHVLRLDRPLEEIEAGFDYSIRKNIRKAERNGVVVQDANSLEELDMYFEMTKVLAQKYNRIPYPKKLFDHVYDIMVPRGEAKFTLTWRDGRPLSGAMHLIEQGHVFNWLMPSYPEHLEHRPNEALIRSILQWAHANGCTLYNFGGSPPDASDLIRFKEKWGAKKQMYQIYGFEGSSVFIRCAAGLGNMVRRVHRDRLDPRFGEGFNNQGS